MLKSIYSSYFEEVKLSDDMRNKEKKLSTKV